jgi:methylmalonyl-CoA mutase
VLYFHRNHHRHRRHHHQSSSLLLQEADAGHIKVICGGVIPPKDYDELYAAGAIGIFGPGTKITDAAEKVLASIQDRK